MLLCSGENEWKSQNRTFFLARQFYRSRIARTFRLEVAKTPEIKAMTLISNCYEDASSGSDFDECTGPTIFIVTKMF